MARSRTILAAVTVAIVLLAAGCSAGVNGPAAPSQPTIPPAPVEPMPVEPMPVEQKRAALPPGFPIEVPVPDGIITGVQQQGDDVWVYSIALAAAPEAALDWYSSAYASANWAEAERSAGRTSRVLFQKGGAQSEVSVAGQSDGSSTAQVTIGIGVPVGETF